jgi:hypothetical protein
MARLGKGALIAGVAGVVVLGLSCMICSSSGLLGGDRGSPPGVAEAGIGAPAVPNGGAAEATAVPAGMTRESPAPLGQPVVTDDEFEITVVDVRRGAEAEAALQSYNMFNTDPKEGMECLLVTVSMKALGDASETQRISRMYYRVTGAKGIIYDTSWDVMGRELASEVFGGATTEGEVSFEVAQDDTQLVLVYSGLGTKARYLALE